MRKQLREAIEALINADGKSLNTLVDDLKNVYAEDRDGMTETSRRIEFLEDCLNRGMSKREAARELVRHDSRVGQRTAETLVYLNFSGRYQTNLRGRRLHKPLSDPPPQVLVDVPADVEDDESLL